MSGASGETVLAFNWRRPGSSSNAPRPGPLASVAHDGSALVEIIADVELVWCVTVARGALDHLLPLAPSKPAEDFLNLPDTDLLVRHLRASSVAEIDPPGCAPSNFTGASDDV